MGESVRRFLVILCVIGGECSCATTTAPRPGPAPAIAANGTDVQCRTERPTGSNLGIEVCTTKAQREAIKASTQAVKQDLGKTQAGACHPPPPC